MLLPGTTYKLYTVLILFVILILLLIRSITKREQIAFYIRNKKLLWKYKKNRRQTIRALDALLKPATKKNPAKNDKETIKSIVGLHPNGYVLKSNSASEIKLSVTSFFASQSSVGTK